MRYALSLRSPMRSANEAAAPVAPASVSLPLELRSEVALTTLR
jgi:hypothetical protein